MALLHAWKNSHWKQRTLVILAALYLIYVLLGFFLVPGLVRDNARQALADLTGRQVHIGEVKFNPLTLTATINEFAIRDEQTRVLVGFRHFYLDFELSSLFRRSWHFDEVLLDQFTVRGQRNPDNAFNVDSLLAHVDQQLAKAEAAKSDEEKQQEAEQEPGPPPPVSIDTLKFTGGELRFTEASSQPSETVSLPVNFTVTDFTTRADTDNQNQYAIRVEGPDGGKLDWQGRFEVDPLLASGKFTVADVDLTPFTRLLRNQVRFTVPSGTLGLGLEYRFASEPEPRLTIQNGHVDVGSLALQKPGEDQPSVVLPRTQLKQIQLDTVEQTLNIPTMTLDEPQIQAVLSDQGLDLATLFLPPDEERAEERVEKAQEKAQATAEKIQEDETEWTVKLDELRIKGSQATFVDRTLSPQQSRELSNGDFTLKNLVVGENTRFQWQGEATLLGEGTLSHEGEGQLAPLAIQASASLDGLPLASLSPWLEQQAPLALTQGALASQLSATVKGEEPIISVNGGATVSGLGVTENGEALVSANELSLSGLDLSTEQQTVAVDEVGITGLDMVNRVDAQGRDTATRITEGLAPASSEESGASEQSAEEGQDKPWQVHVARLRLVGNQLRHEDQSASPAFRAGLYDLSGSIRNLDTRPGERAQVDLDGEVDRYAPFSAKGQVAAEPLFVDMTVSVDNYDMTSLTPFTARYLGFAVKKGQLGVGSDIKIDTSNLASSVSVQADQFYLGEKQPSDEAIKAPVKLGLAVLRSRSGAIELPVELSGDMNDPSFSVSGMVMTVFKNIIVKAATAPFSMLASLAGGKNLENIAFQPGSAEVEKATRSSLESLSKVLAKRPGLKVALTGHTNKEDRQALAAAAIGRDMAGDQWPGIDTALSGEQWPRPILSRYERQFDKESETLASKSLPEEEAERDRALARLAWQALVKADAQAMSKETLAELARQRAENAKAMLVNQLDVSPARLYLSQVKTAGKVAGLTLKLAKH